MKSLKKLLNNTRQIFKVKDNPKSVARGFALGSFIGMMPIPGFQMIISLAIASILKVNKKAACIGVFNTNIATGVFIFAFNYKLGKMILGINSEFTMPNQLSFGFIKTVFNSGTEVMLSLTVGGIITGIVAAIVGYNLTYMQLTRRKLSIHQNQI